MMATAFAKPINPVLIKIGSSISTLPNLDYHHLFVDPGDSLNQIADKLKKEGLIHSAGLFKTYSFLIGAAHRFQPGIYGFSQKDSLSKIVRSLILGPQPVLVFIPEGMTLKDLDSKLGDLLIIKKGQLINFAEDKLLTLKSRYWFLKGRDSLEGFLFPDTYKFIPGAGVDVVVGAMLDNFNAKATPLLSNKKDWYSILILASLLEKEIPAGSERQLVADILRRRVALGMPLQVDSTVTYIKCQGEYIVCQNRRLAKADFKVDSPYNTYLYKGLPPGPISNPGLSAIQSALNPKKNKYLFYLSDPRTQRTVFSETFDEHNDNRFKYLNE